MGFRGGGGVKLTPLQRILVFKYLSRDRVKRNTKGRPLFVKLIGLSNFFFMHFMSFINYLKPKTIFKSHVYWDTLYILAMDSQVRTFVLCNLRIKHWSPSYTDLRINLILFPYPAIIQGWSIDPQIKIAHTGYQD